MKLSLEDRLERLERRLGGEALSANYLTTDAAGHVSANFSGTITADELDLVADNSAPSPINWITTGGAQVALLESDANGNLTLEGNSLTIPAATATSFSGEINAQGVILPASTVTNPPPNSVIGWNRSGGSGAQIARIYAFDSAPEEQLYVTASGSPANAGALVDVGAIDTAANFADLTAAASGAGANTSVSVQANAQELTILNALGQSQLLINANGPQVLAFDYASHSLAGGSSFTFAHSIGRVPRIALAGTNQNGVVANVTSSTSSQLTVSLDAISGTIFYPIAVYFFALG